MIKSSFALAAASIAVMLTPPCHATVARITSYNGLLEALNNGHRVMAVADNAKCTVKEYDNPDSKSDGMPEPDLESVMGINFSSHFFIKYRDKGDKRYHILAIANSTGSYADGTPIQRYKQIKIFDDNTARVSAAAG